MLRASIHGRPRYAYRDCGLCCDLECMRIF
jgi:hypothetical protein